MYDYLIVGGGSAGCVLANRLSARASNRVILIEAGRDTPPDAVPDDIRDEYGGRAMVNPDYLWTDLRVRLAESGASEPDVRYEQARVMGGASSINGQVATRGAPEDYDQWQRLGALGWDWAGVLPYFRRLERDLDFDGPVHGGDGPIAIRRVQRDQWDPFTNVAVDALDGRGYRFVPDLNDGFAEGYSPIPINTLEGERISSAVAYLNREVRSRPNLRIMPLTRARRLLFEGRRVSGVEVGGPEGAVRLNAAQVIVSAGALHSPALLLRSGIGPAERIGALGIDAVADRRGVGHNLQEHPAVTVSAYLPAQARQGGPGGRQNYVYLRYGSGVPGCGSPDMLMNFVCKSGWHPIGRRLCTIQTYILQPFSRGKVDLKSPEVDAEPDVRFNLLSDARDLARTVDAVRRTVDILRTAPVAALARHPFLSSYSDRVRAIGAVGWRNRLLTAVLAGALDLVWPVRGFLIGALMTDAPPIGDLVADDAALEEHVRRAVTGVWHPTGTCRMGSPDDPMAVTDPQGRVYGVEGLRVADASVMPEIPRANTNIPVIMVGEKIADAALQSA